MDAVLNTYNFNMNNLQQNLELAASALQEADALIITAGAGIGVDSGLPDFRGNEGFWKAYTKIAKLGKSFTQMANPDWFRKDPSIAWAFYGHRLNLYRKTQPHQGFFDLLKIGTKIGDYFVFTSNVDGQFQKAGFDDLRIEECHGSIHHFQCVSPCSEDIWNASDETVSVDEEEFIAYEPFPVCRNCGGIARPNILMFGDWFWIHNRSNEQGSRFRNWISNHFHNHSKIAIIELGAGTTVATVRYQSESLAENDNATLIRINPRDYYVPNGGISIPLGAKEGILKISHLLQ